MAAEPYINHGDPLYWFELVDTELSKARLTLRTGRYFLLGLSCQQACEKVLSGWFVRSHPMHELPVGLKLPEQAAAMGLWDGFSAEQRELLSRLQGFKSGSQSEADKQRLQESLDDAEAAELLSQAEEFVEYIRGSI
ncbi:MAG: HEPN domain-containing protein [Coriobacteriales bacterium]|nr:HEPN domain-containing protein [Coriobacteriales bacterium]